MKALFTFLFIFFVSFFSFGQGLIEWEQIGAPDTSRRDIVYMSKEGSIIAIDVNLNDLFISIDKGVSWKYLFKAPIGPVLNYYYEDYNLFREDSISNIYFKDNSINNKSTIYYIDVVTNSINKWHDFEEEILDFNFLENGDLIYCTKQSLKILDISNFTIKKSTILSCEHAEIFISKGYKNYIGSGFASNHIQEFDNDLNFIGNANIAFNKLTYTKGRFISSESNYSDNGGKNWFPLQNIISSSLFVGHDGVLYSNRFFSKDNGETFQVIENLSNFINFMQSDKYGNIVASNNSCSLTKIQVYSADSGKSWTNINIGQNVLNADYVVAGLDQNIISTQCETQTSYLSKNSKSWKILEVPGSSFFFSEKPISLPNGKFLYADYVNFIISNDFKKINYFNKIPSLSIDIPPVIKKNELYMIGYDSIYVSKDFNKVDKSYNIKAAFSPFFAIPTSNDKIISYDGSWFLFDYIKNSRQDLMFDGDFINCNLMESSFNGKNIYGINHDFDFITETETLYFYKSNDEGLTFKKYYISKLNAEESGYKLKVDHLENIYLFNENKILFSFDQGETWLGITPTEPKIIKITDLSISYDNFIYVSTFGLGIIKSKFPQEDPKSFTVKVRNDANENCIAETSENSPIFGTVTLENSYTKPLDENGETVLRTYLNKQFISLNLNEKIYQQCAINYEVNIDTITNTGEITIPVKTLQECADLKIGISAPLLRRCFANTYYGYIKNEGNITSENTNITLTLDEFFEFETSTLQVVSYNHPLLVLNVPNIPANETIFYNVVVKIKCEATLGQEHCIKAKIYASNICADPQRTDYMECQINRGSFDPNDKAIFVAGIKDAQYTNGNDKMEYTIRFQNTGTDTAFTVRVEDNIASEFDIKSFRPIAASHNFTYEIKRGRNLVVTFDKINLVDSFTNEPLSHGFIKFEIKLDTSARLDDKLFNQAEIYFDFNDGVITNKVKTINGFPTKTDDVKIDHDVYAVPNPTSTEVSIKGNLPSNQVCTVNVFDINGKLISQQKTNTSNIKINCTDFPSGQYIVKINTNDNYYFSKIVKI